MTEDTTAAKRNSTKVSNASADDGRTASRSGARGVATTTVEKVRESVGSVATEAVGAAKKAANEGKDKATEALSGVAKVVNDAAQVVEDKVGATYGNYARRAADGVTGFAQNLQNKDIDDLITDARNFVRKNPAVAIGAAAAVGFVLTRLIKVGSASETDLTDEA